jgi:hypothetical protein
LDNQHDGRGKKMKKGIENIKMEVLRKLVIGGLVWYFIGLVLWILSTMEGK